MDAIMDQPFNILLLGGTSEAVIAARHLATMPGIAATLSLAGRTNKAAPSPLPVRIGGFGGIDGLASYLTREAVNLVLDATHPFAAQISGNAVAACAEANVPLLAIERPPWKSIASDDWREHRDIEAAIAALPDAPQTVFSALGRSSIPKLVAKPQHRYIIRVVDPIDLPSELMQATAIVARGPFRTEDDIALFREHHVTAVLAKNSGGDAAYSKIEAARHLHLPVYMVTRPPIADRRSVATVSEALSWIAHRQASRAERGV
jgi:precorrin-6A/cobalt-precorrin-6A reductase